MPGPMVFAGCVCGSGIRKAYVAGATQASILCTRSIYR